MKWDMVFFINSALLGIGLAMDAFSVSMANGLNEPNMKKGRMNLIAGVYSFFQFAMPMIGWVCVHTIVEKFNSFEKFIPWISFGLLAYIGGEMIVKGIRKEESSIEEKAGLPFGKLLVQGVATSLDALSVGFTIEQYQASMALVASLIIAVVTHVICIGGLVIGKRFGNRLADKASIFGGVILVGIGIEILVSHLV